MHPFTVIIGQSEHPFASSGALHKFVNELPARDVPITFMAVCWTCRGGTVEPPQLPGQPAPCPGCRGSGGGKYAFKSTDELKAFVQRTVPIS
jgi:hypothetical protein